MIEKIIRLDGKDKLYKHVDDIKITNNLTMLYAPPGRGKTYAIIKKFSRLFHKVYFLVPEISLAKDLVNTSLYKNEIGESFISKKHTKYGKGNVVICNYDRFYNIQKQITNQDIVVIDEADSIIRDDYRTIMKDIRDFIILNTHKTLLMTGTGTALDGWLRAFEEYKKTNITYYICKIEEQYKDHCLIINSGSHKSTIIKILKELLINDVTVGVYYNDRNILQDISFYLDSIKIDNNVITATNRNRTFNKINKYGSKKYVFLFTKSVERGVSSINQIDYMISPLTTRHTIDSAIQATDRERIKKVKKIFVYSPTQNGLIKYLGKHHSFNLSHQDISDILLQQRQEKEETDDSLQQLIEDHKFNKYDYYAKVDMFYYLLTVGNIKKGFKKHQMYIHTLNDKESSIFFPEIPKRFNKNETTKTTERIMDDYKNLMKYDLSNIKDVVYDEITFFNEKDNLILRNSIPRIKLLNEINIDLDENVYVSLMRINLKKLIMFIDKRKNIKLKRNYKRKTQIYDDIRDCLMIDEDIINDRDCSYFLNIFYDIKKNKKNYKITKK